jgi:thiamine biosynthesis lipoprotein
MNEYRISKRLMGSGFELKIGCKSETEANHFLEIGIKEIERIEELISEFKENALTTKINQNAGIQPVKVSQEVFDLIKRSLKISALTQGAFDISAGVLKKLYYFKNKDFTFPEKEIIQNTLAKVGWQKIDLNPTDLSVFLTKKNMHISFAAIGKGYAADQVKKVWLKNGVSSGVINASGDLTAFGKRPDRSSWNIGIANPDNKTEMLFFVPIENASVATSGDYEQFFMHHGIRHSHNINPITGLPLKGIKSVSIFSPSAELSDALATAVYVMGVDTGLHFVNQLPNTHAIIIDDKNDISFSKKLDLVNEI